MKTILVPTDGSKTAAKALDVAMDLAKQHDATIKLFHVLMTDKEPCELLRLPEIDAAGDGIVSSLKGLNEAPPAERSAEDLMGHRDAPDRPTPEAVLREIGSHVLSRAEGQASARGVAVDVLDVSTGTPAEAIVRAANEANADTIVMGSRGLRQIESVAFGSVSQQVCRSSACTCVAVH